MPLTDRLAALRQANPDDLHELHIAVASLRAELALPSSLDEEARDALLDTADELQAAAPADRPALLLFLLAQLQSSTMS